LGREKRGREVYGLGERGGDDGWKACKEKKVQCAGVRNPNRFAKETGTGGGRLNTWAGGQEKS